MLDDCGLKPLQDLAPEGFYDIIDGRYERGSILLTSNRAPAEWPDLFGSSFAGLCLARPLAAPCRTFIITG